MATAKEILSSIGAPLLGAVLGGPPGIAAGAASILAPVLGLSNNSSKQGISVQDITKRITEEVNDNPEAAFRIRELELKYQQYLLNLKFQMDQAEYADRADARAREVAITKATGTRDWFAAGLGVFVVLGFTIVLSFMLSRPIYKDNDKELDAATSAIVNILVGALTAGYSTVLSYYFGSSAGSKNKDGTIALLTRPSESKNTSSESRDTSVEASPVPIDPSPPY